MVMIMKKLIACTTYRIIEACIGVVVFSSFTFAQPSRAAVAKDLTDMSLEDLMEIKVTSVSKRDQSAGEVAAALFVLNSEDIRRSGARTIPELLRQVPGLNVAQIDTNRWAITARGSNSLFATKLLVLIDGRSVYTPTFSGVYWDAQDTRIEDIERIEVIRGPGASVWGANAVNGVINIITKSAKETVGGAAAVGGGSEEQGFANVRYGEKISDTSAARIYGKYFNRDRSANNVSSQVDAYDQWEAGQGGARFDYKEGRDTLTLQGDVYGGNDGLQAQIPSLTSPVSSLQRKSTRYNGQNVLAHWQREFQSAQKLDLQVYYDRTERHDLIHGEQYDTFDIDTQYFIPATQTNELMFGGGYRNIGDSFNDTDTVSFGRRERDTELFSGFIQDEQRFFNNELRFTLGSKFEHNDYTGFEYQPTARLAWIPSATQTVWAAYSRAARSPSRVQDSGRVLVGSVPLGQGAPPLPVYILGTKDSVSEILNAFEIGYRTTPVSNFSVDVSTYYNRYDNLSNFSQGAPQIGPSGRLELPEFLNNQSTSTSYGVEAVTSWNPVSNWKLQTWYSWSTRNFEQPSTTVDSSGLTNRVDPHNQAFLRSLVTLPRNIDLDAYLRYIDNIPAYRVDGYIDLTLRVAWRYSDSVEFAVVGSNLLHDKHREYVADSILVSPAEIQRAVLGSVSFKF